MISEPNPVIVMFLEIDEKLKIEKKLILREKIKIHILIFAFADTF